MEVERTVGKFRRFAKIKTNKSGESLIETVVSFLVLSIAILAVTMMLNTAIRIKNTSLEKLQALQDDASAIEAGEAQKVSGTVGRLRISVSGRNIDINLDIHREGTFYDFAPAD